MQRWVKVTLFIIAVIGVIALIGGILFSRRQPAMPETTEVTTHTVTQDVEFTGRLQAQQTATLGFETSGTAREVAVEVGDTVSPGQTLITLDPSLGELEVAKARADRLAATDSAAVAQSNAETAYTATVAYNARLLESARQNVRDTKQELDQAHIVWDKTVRESGDESSAAQTKYGLVKAAQTAYNAARTSLSETEKSVAKSNDAAQATLDSARVARRATEQASQAAAGISSLAAAEQIAGVRLAKNTLRAPFGGVVTEKKVAAGEVAVGGQGVLTIQTVDQMEIVAQVAETDVTKLTINLPASVTLDAYDDQVTWSVEVLSIDPAAVILEGVPTYRVRLRFLQSDITLRPGLTANVVVHAARKENVLAVPRRAVSHKVDSAYVRVRHDDGTIEEKKVSTGLSGSNGLIEITSGLQRGERVIVRDPSS